MSKAGKGIRMVDSGGNWGRHFWAPQEFRPPAWSQLLERGPRRERHRQGLTTEKHSSQQETMEILTQREGFPTLPIHQKTFLRSWLASASRKLPQRWKQASTPRKCPSLVLLAALACPFLNLFLSLVSIDMLLLSQTIPGTNHVQSPLRLSADLWVASIPTNKKWKWGCGAYTPLLSPQLFLQMVEKVEQLIRTTNP